VIIFWFLDTSLDISSGVHSGVRSEIFKIFREMIFEVSSGVSPGFFNRYKIYCVQRTFVMILKIKKLLCSVFSEPSHHRDHVATRVDTSK